MTLPPLYPVLDVEAASVRGHDLAALARGLAALGCTVQQLRAKNLPSGPFLAVVRRLVEQVPQLIVNDRADLARLGAAAGLHIGADDLPAAQARPLLGPGMLLGISTHNPAQIAFAGACAPDYLAIGPVFATSTKLRPDPVVGLEGIAVARRLWRGPLVAIGGITAANCADVWRAGADSVAVIAALCGTPDPLAAAGALLARYAARPGR